MDFIDRIKNEFDSSSSSSTSSSSYKSDFSLPPEPHKQLNNVPTELPQKANQPEIVTKDGNLSQLKDSVSIDSTDESPISPKEDRNIGWQQVKNANEKTNNVMEDLLGSVWINGAALITIVFVTWLVVSLGGGLSTCLIIAAFASTYYRNSVRRYRRNVRDELTKKLMQDKLESDFESAEWLNSFLQKFWLIYEPVLSATIISVVDPILEASTPPFLDSIRMSTFTLGSKAPRIDQVRTHFRTEADVILMEWDLSFIPNDVSDMTTREIQSQINPKIILTVNLGKGIVGLPILLEDLVLRGKLRIELKLMNNFPHIRTFSFCFLSKPTIDYSLKPLGGETFGIDVAHIPGLQPFIRDLVHANLEPMMYNPNIFTIDLDQMMNSTHYEANHAIGALKITIRNSKGLKNIDLIGTIDPYVKLHLNHRGELARTSVRYDSLNPVWDETHFILLHNLNDTLFFELFSKNSFKKDPFLASAEYPLRNLSNEPEKFDVTLPLTSRNKSNGTIQFTLDYFPVIPPTIEEGVEIPAETNSGILWLNISQAKELFAKSGQYDPFMITKMNNTVIHKTKTLKKTSNPVWEKTVEIFVSDLENSRLFFDIKDDKELLEDPRIASLNIKITDALQRIKKQHYWFRLDGISTGKIKLDLKWRPVKTVILESNRVDQILEESPLGMNKANTIADPDILETEHVHRGPNAVYERSRTFFKKKGLFKKAGNKH